MTTKTTKRRTALSSALGSKTFERVLIVANEVVVLCMRYLLERMTEQRILEIDAAGDVANCSVTE